MRRINLPLAVTIQIFKVVMIFLIAGVCLVFSTACASIGADTLATDEPNSTNIPPTEQPDATSIDTNLTNGCVESYDPSVDYFPDKVSLTYAEGWTIEYFNNYKVVDVVRPWQDAEQTFQYVLVQCGTPAPEGFDTAQVIEVPARTIATMSTTHLSHLDKLGLLEALVGVDNGAYINTPAVRQMIDKGGLVEIGSGASVNIELVLDLEPDLVMTYGSGNPEFDAHPKLLEAGLHVPLNSEYMETTPLGRAEWLKFTALFFNREATAEQVFEQMATRYETIAAEARAIETRPTVFTGADFGGVWSMPGGQSFVANFLADAGADYLWAEDNTTGSFQLDFEAVYEQAAEAEFWLNPGAWASLEEALAADARYGDFAAFQNSQVYNNNARLNENGGNDYWESGVTNPDVVLADLIKIFHPELLPEHELVYYQPLQ